MSEQKFDPGPLAEVAYEQEGDRHTLVFTRFLAHPPEKVWEALTEPEQMKHWAPYVPDGSLGVTGERTFRMIDGSTDEPMAATVARAERPRLLEYSFQDGRLVWELTAHNDGTLLTLRHTVPNADWVTKIAAGWHLCLVVAERLLEGNPIPPIVGAAAVEFGWERLNDAYAQQMGLESSGFPEDRFPDSKL
ncbi:ATPase [candidate division GN15 bacterium]|nr:ATPase [candidate division GN15 bacterium]